MPHSFRSWLLAAILLPALAAAQSAPPHDPQERRHRSFGTVTGRVVLADGQPADQVSIRVKGTGHGTTPKADGSFELRVPAGWQVVTVSSLGYGTQEFSVEVTHGQPTALPLLTLARGDQQLREVTVTGAKSLNQRPISVGKLAIAPLDLPQSVVTVERAVLEQQQALRLSDVLTNVSGVYVMGATGGTQEEIASRGFAYTSHNTFKNGVRFNNGVMPEVSSLERLEVLKGSAAILYGNVAAGGILNLVTKKPRFESGGSVGLRVGSYGFVKPQLDVYGAVGGSPNVAYRLNGTYERSDSYRDGVTANRTYVNPSLLFRVSPHTELVVEGDYLRDRRTPDFGIGAVDYQIFDSRTRFLNTPDARNATTQTSATATLTSRLSATWQVRTVAGFQRYDNELRSATRPTASVSKPGRSYGDWLRSLQRTETAENYYLAQVDLTGRFRTGGLDHALLLGADADQYNTNALTYFSQPYDSLNLLDASRQLGQPKSRVGGYDALGYSTRTLGNTRRAGFYAQDLLSLLDHVKLLAGLRWSYQETPSDVYNYRATLADGSPAVTVKDNRRYDHAFSPRLGLVYQPVKTTALFVSYANSFTPQSNTVQDLEGQPLPPSLIDQYEVGLKNDLFQGALSANVTAYHIVNSNQLQSVLPTDPRFSTAKSSSPQELAGQVTSQGVEVDVQSRPAPGWSLITGYSYNHAAYTRSNIFENGSRLRYAPAHTANLSVFYTFDQALAHQPLLKGLTAGVTTFYIGDRLAGRNPRLLNPATGLPFPNGDANKYIAVPDYFLLDASVGYAYHRFSVRGKLANLLNELSYNVHDDNSVNPIAPRTYSATLTYHL